MSKSIEGVYRRGRVELTELPRGIPEETRVIVTFLENENDLPSRGIDETQAAEIRRRLAAFAEEWDSPEMSIYDRYDAARARL